MIKILEARQLAEHLIQYSKQRKLTSVECIQCLDIVSILLNDLRKTFDNIYI